VSDWLDKLGKKRDCRKCKRWKDCPGKWCSYTENGKTAEAEWYHYGEIRWCPRQVIWILQYADIFRAGFWVTQHIESGGIQKLKVEAYFVKAGIAIGELEVRFETVPNQGELLITQVEDERKLDDLSPGAYEILMYVKGKDRKSINFKRWEREVWKCSKTGKKHQFSQNLTKN